MASSSPRRHILVVANSDYSDGRPLQNAVNDGTEVAKVLTSICGFALLGDKVHTNLTLREFDLVLKAAIVDLEKSPGTISGLYYAGHGCEIRGEKYLLPVDFYSPASEKGKEKEDDDKYETIIKRSISLGSVYRQLETHSPSVLLSILDCCRELPPNLRGLKDPRLRRLEPLQRQNGSTLALGPHSFLIFSCGPGEQANDETPLVLNQSGRHSLFAYHLLKHLATPNLSLHEMIQRVGKAVELHQGIVIESKTFGTKGQHVWYETNLFDRVCLVPGSGGTSGSAPPSQLSQLAVLHQPFPKLPPGYVERLTVSGSTQEVEKQDVLVAQVQHALFSWSNYQESAAASVGVSAHQYSATAVQGMGGVGKTVVAIAVCHSRAVREYFDDVYWISVGSEAEVARVQCNLLRKLGQSPPEHLQVDEYCAMINSAIKGKRVLIVLDDVWKARVVKGFQLDADQPSRILVTSRDRKLLRGSSAVIDVGKLDERTALALLYKTSGHPVDVEPQQATEVARICGYLALALNAIAHAVDAVVDGPWTEALRLLFESEEALLHMRGGDDSDSDIDDDDDGLRRTVFNAIHASVGVLPAAHQAHYLALACAFKEDWHIADDVAVGFFEEGGLSTQEAGALKRTLESKSLIQRVSQTPPRFQIHDLQRAYAFAWFKRAPKATFIREQNSVGRFLVRPWDSPMRPPDTSEEWLYLRALHAFEISLSRPSCTINKIQMTTTWCVDWMGVARPQDVDNVSTQRSVITFSFLGKVLENNVSVQELDLNGNHIGDYGAALLGKALSLNSALQRLNLCRNEISESGIAAICEGLQNNCALQELHIALNRIGHGGDQAIAAMLKRNTSLQLLDAHHCGLDAMAIAGALKHNASLHNLILSHNSIDSFGAVALGAALEENLGLHEVKLSGNLIRTGHFVALLEGLARNKSVQVLLLSDSREKYGRDAFQSASGCLALALKRNNSLKTLDLSGNSIGFAMELAQGLEGNNGIQTLNLTRCSISDDDASAIGEALKHNSSLQTLDLSHNHIRSRGVGAIAHGLSQNTGVKTLDLSSNELLIGDAVAIGNALENNSNLQVLKLESHGFSSRGGIPRNNRLGADDAYAIGCGLLHNSALLTVNICGAEIGDAGAVSIGKALERNNTLRELNLEGDGKNERGQPPQDWFELPTGEAISVFLDESMVEQIAPLQSTPTEESTHGLSEARLPGGASDLDGSTPARVGIVGATAIGSALKHNHCLRVLNLKACLSGDSCISGIAEALAHNNTLKELILSCNRIGNDGAVAICRGLANNHTLQTLDLSNNLIGEVGADAFDHVLEQNITLQELKWYGNPTEFGHSHHSFGKDGIRDRVAM